LPRPPRALCTQGRSCEREQALADRPITRLRRSPQPDARAAARRRRRGVSRLRVARICVGAGDSAPRYQAACQVAAARVRQLSGVACRLARRTAAYRRADRRRCGGTQVHRGGVAAVIARCGVDQTTAVDGPPPTRQPSSAPSPLWATPSPRNSQPAGSSYPKSCETGVSMKPGSGQGLKCSAMMFGKPLCSLSTRPRTMTKGVARTSSRWRSCRPA